MRICLFLGFLLLFLAFWKGDGGYLDLREYLDDAERLWLKADMRLPGEPGTPPEYNRYSLGLPFLSGPFVLAGQAIQWLSGDAIGRRQVAALCVPVLAAVAGVLLFEIARLLGFSKRIGIYAALIYCLGSPHLTYARLFYADAAVECGILFAMWSFFKYADMHSGKWALLTGTGLAAAGASHYPHAALVCFVWVNLAAGMFSINSEENTFRLKARDVLLFGAVPILCVGILVGLNLSRHGHLVPRGYQGEVSSNISPRYIFGNLHHLGRMCLRTPWFFPALGFGVYALWHLKPRTAVGKFLAIAMLSGVIAQLVLWLCYYQLNMFPFRYLHPMSALGAIGLPFLLQWIDDRFPTRGVTYTVLILLLANAVQFTGDTIFQPIFAMPPAGEIWMYTWYMSPIAPGTPFDGGSPAGALQFAVFGVLIGLGTWLLINASAIARKDSSG